MAEKFEIAVGTILCCVFLVSMYFVICVFH